MGKRALRRRFSRRRSSFRGAPNPGARLIMLGGGAFVLIAAFVFFLIRADQLAPAPQEMRIELPDAFK